MAENGNLTPRESLRSFALELYGMEAVSHLCLAWQYGHGVDVTVLLAAAWASSTGRPVTPEEIRKISSAVEHWRSDVVEPLRNVRRRLKMPVGSVSPEAAERLRKAVKAAELEGELIALDTLADCCPPRQAGAEIDVALRKSIEAVFRHFSPEAAPPAGDLERLASAAACVARGR